MGQMEISFHNSQNLHNYFSKGLAAGPTPSTESYFLAALMHSTLFPRMKQSP
jgi:hypothetical protein